MTLNDRELRTLAAISQALLPADSSGWAAEVPLRAGEYLRYLSPRNLAQVRLGLRLVESPASAALLSTFALRPRAFSALDVEQRRQILLALATSRLPLVRAAFDGFKRLLAVAYYADCTADGRNPTWDALAYPGPLARASGSSARTIQVYRIDSDTTLTCDVAVIGSGPGGAVVASELAARGWQVAVLEKGEYLEEDDFDQREVATLQRAYLGAGLLATADRGITLLAGSCLGGGSLVNFTTSFRTPEAVRAEWEALTGSPMLARESFTHALDSVCARLGVNTNHNAPAERDQIMARGLKALGWHVDAMPRNVVGCTQDDVCGYCGLGCIRGAKQSTVKTYLQDASDQGARIVVECAAERITASGARSIRVSARTGQGHKVLVDATVAVLGAGALHTPAILLRSGVRGSVGSHLHLHPVTAVWGRFEAPVRPWTGTLQAFYSDQFARLDGGYGVRLETAPIHPAYLALATPWTEPSEFNAHMRQLPYLSPIGVLLRDRSVGRVRLDRRGQPVLRYALSRYDQAHVRTGVIAAARVLAAAGARAIFSSHYRRLSWVPEREALDTWVSRLDALGYGVHDVVYGSWHQMGSCRIDGSAQSAVNAFGEVRGLPNVFVADASLFPSASGVNPMISIAALAYQVAQSVHRRLDHIAVSK
jgi:choline dehydrogenase-like flavoprotein